MTWAIFFLLAALVATGFAGAEEVNAVFSEARSFYLGSAPESGFLRSRSVAAYWHHGGSCGAAQW